MSNMEKNKKPSWYKEYTKTFMRSIFGSDKTFWWESTRKTKEIVKNSLFFDFNQIQIKPTGKIITGKKFEFTDKFKNQYDKLKDKEGKIIIDNKIYE